MQPVEIKHLKLAIDAPVKQEKPQGINSIMLASYKLNCDKPELGNNVLKQKWKNWQKLRDGSLIPKVRLGATN